MTVLAILAVCVVCSWVAFHAGRHAEQTHLDRVASEVPAWSKTLAAIRRHAREERTHAADPRSDRRVRRLP